MTKQNDETLAIDLHNRVTGEELEKLLKMQLNALAANPEMASALPPLMVWGAPGLGKSSILQSLLMLRQSYDVDYLNKDEKQIRLNGHFVNMENANVLCYTMASDRNVVVSVETENGSHTWTIDAQEPEATNPSCVYEGDDYKTISLFSDSMEFLTAERLGPRYEYRVQSDKAYNTKLGVQGELTPAYLYKSLQQNENIGMDGMLFDDGNSHAIDKQLINNVNAWMSWIMNCTTGACRRGEKMRRTKRWTSSSTAAVN